MSWGTAVLGGILVFLVIGNIAVTIANKRLIKRRQKGHDHGGGPDRKV